MTIDYGKGRFKGKVRSRSNRCERRRRITIKRAKRGRDAVVGRVLTNRRGVWKLRFPRAKGRFYARAGVKSNPAWGRCRTARSRTTRA